MTKRAIITHTTIRTIGTTTWFTRFGCVLPSSSTVCLMNHCWTVTSCCCLAKKPVQSTGDGCMRAKCSVDTWTTQRWKRWIIQSCWLRHLKLVINRWRLLDVWFPNLLKSSTSSRCEELVITIRLWTRFHSSRLSVSLSVEFIFVAKTRPNSSTNSPLINVVLFLVFCLPRRLTVISFMRSTEEMILGKGE